MMNNLINLVIFSPVWRKTMCSYNLLKINMNLNSENNITTEKHKYKTVNIFMTFFFRQTYHTPTDWNPYTRFLYLSRLILS